MFLGAYAPAATIYVNLNSTNPVPPYADWSTAATNIQGAVDVSTNGDLILVTDGVYQTESRVSPDGGNSRVVVTNAITLQSVNGPAVTAIDGSHLVRCLYLGPSAVFDGFTLTNGSVGNNHNGGGVYCASTNALVSNCLVINNTATWGGGGYGGTYINCMFIGNTTPGTGYGGGVGYGALYDCMVSNNVSSFVGGGAYQSSLYRCAVAANSAYDGGGAASCALMNCTVAGNYATVGGGAYDSSVQNCSISGNSSQVQGAGASYSILTNCTVVGNFYIIGSSSIPGSIVSGSGAGTYICTNANCILAYNNTPDGLANYYGSTMNYCCTFPLPASGTGNIDEDPAMSSLTHLSINSPCRNAGNAMYASGVDIDGEAWASPPSIGCDEYIPGAVSGPLTVALQSAYASVVPVFSNSFTAQIDGRVSLSVWDFGDGTTVSNSPYVSHAWANPGIYPVVLKAYNKTCPGGISATSMVYVSQIVYYVDANSTNPTPPYTNWSTAATNIQDALDVASTAGALVLVANGVYRSGGTVSSDGSTNCVVVNWPVTLQSVNGPAVTMIDGSHLMRCAYLTNGIVLTGFTLTNGYLASGYGGGIYCATTNVLVSNCLALSNTAADGGGVYCGTLNNCTLTGNTATNSLGGSGGGAYESVLNYCLLDDNSANDGGGALGCTLSSCVISNNLAVVSTSRYPYPPGQGGGVYSGTAHNCLIVSNTAAYQLLGSSGGGAYDGALVNCTLLGNFATSGAGAFDCSLVNCALVGNRATSGGGAFYDIYGRGLGLDHCLINANGAQVGGGVYSAYLTNCIVNGNWATSNGAGVYLGSLFDSTVCLNSATNQGGGIWGSSAQNSIIYTTPHPPDLILGAEALNLLLHLAVARPGG